MDPHSLLNESRLSLDSSVDFVLPTSSWLRKGRSPPPGFQTGFCLLKMLSTRQCRVSQEDGGRLGRRDPKGFEKSSLTIGLRR